MIHLYKKSAYFNPLHIDDPRNGKERAIDKIALFNEKGEVWSTNWFVKKDGYTSCDGFIIEGLTLKFVKAVTPELFKGEGAFFTTEKQSYSDELRAQLYLPLKSVKGERS